ncbi:Pls/PosA family non-ribosomal peptide synthetase [Arthrobacter halodurans]|uniref:Pls/PosA family non-ribosomal peptide synthetase n=1 Tax=Arthrobacter halodurans TaxID=516699 RepID=A0ABV4UQN0_9MICC
MTMLAGGPGDQLQGTVLGAPEADDAIRWRPGQRLDTLFEERCDALAAAGRSAQLAVDSPDATLTYGELDAAANRLARYLAAQGAGPGTRVALLFDQPVRSYVALLAVLKTGAAYVPLDAGFPEDRLAYIVGDAGVSLVLTLSHLRAKLPRIAARTLCLDEEDPAVARQDPSRPAREAVGATAGELAYIIYTSGSTGRPKGVAVDHPSICNFVLVAAETYGYEPGDRVYQGMTIAFDFSVEEIWVPWMVGATLVPKPGGSALLGMDLSDYLQERRITAMCCVPTLLATLDEDLPGLRFLLVSGEACPKDLVTRWHRPGRRFLNVYGPTEATVTATWDVVHPDKPVTLGVPLPTYSAVILDPEEARALPAGELGEIGIAGIGLARGYVNRDDLTERAFIPDFLGIENNPSGRIYRTGDLGRFTPEGTIEYLGRIDTQVKIRGYRIELSEIESVLLEHPAIALAVVDTHSPAPGVVELAAYYTLRGDAAGLDEAELDRALRERLPAYMVPAYLDRLDTIPLMPSGKADRKNLPAPTARRAGGNAAAYVPPETDAERALAEQLGAVLGLERPSVDAHFFDDLGANSLLMAHFCAGIRRHTDLPSAAMQDVYQQPTLRRLAAMLEAERMAAELASAGAEPAAPPAPRPAPSSLKYTLTGAAQLLFFLGYTTYAALLLVFSFTWVSAAPTLFELWLRSIAFGAGMFVVLTITPVLFKWALVGRMKQQVIPLWGLGYLRFWIVRLVTRASPMAAFVGSPLYVVYLRMLGARIGKGVSIFSRIVPACPDLISIGEGTVIHKNAVMLGYRVRRGVIETGPVTIGNNVLVSQKTVFDIGTAMGDDSQLGHASALHEGQSVPAGEVWHGSPAVPAATSYARIRPRRCGTRRRVVFSAFQLFNRLVLVVPGGLILLAGLLPGYLETGHLEPTNPLFYLDAALLSLALFIGGMVSGLVAVLTVPRLLNLATPAETTFPLYGIRYALHRMVLALTNIKPYLTLFGDSSYIVHYLKALGWDLGKKIDQTGSNFGPGVAHDSPYLSKVGYGTMVSDGLNMMNAEYTSTSFRLSVVEIGDRNFLGNDITWPIASRVGENCLLGTKVLVPIDGPVRRDVGLLGSPAFEIPRSVQRDSQFDDLKLEDAKSRLLPAKNRHNIGSMALYLALRWFQLFSATVIGALSVALYDVLGVLAVGAGTLIFLVYGILLSAFAERAVLGFGRLEPRFCSIYDPYFWHHERLWKLLGGAPFTGTPFRPMVWRLFGVKVGKRLYDGGGGLVEKTLVSIGDDCELNEASILQGHSLEDGTFKSGHITLGNGCTIGVAAFIHYGVNLQDGAEVAADSFLMKGEDLPVDSLFGGNPARELDPARQLRRVAATA